MPWSSASRLICTSSGRTELLAACPEADILVTNNAVPPPGSLDDAGSARRGSPLSKRNMIAPILLIRALLPGMRARKFGRIVNITSAMVKSPHSLMGLSASQPARLLRQLASQYRGSLPQPTMSR